MHQESSIPVLNTILFTGIALIAFAANSVLCRLALGEHTIDAASFSIIRLLSGAIVLSVLLLFKHKKQSHSNNSWLASSMLFLYAVTFSFAYITLDTGTGALILFGSVQITLIFLALMSGTKLLFVEWTGVSIAFAGFVYLILPGVSTPSLLGFTLMTIAGIAWGIYTLKGKSSANPLADTAINFVRTIPFLILLALFTFQNALLSKEGIVLAILSGTIASGIGYSIWYMALAGLSTTQAAVVQLLVPVIAALGGVLFVSEAITLRLFFSATMVLGGIFLVVVGRYYFDQKNTRIQP